MAISEEYTAIAFYGIDLTQEAVACLYDTVVGWFNEIGHPPGKAAITGEGHSGKFVSFERADSRIRKSGFQGITDFECYVLMDNAIFLANDYLVAARCSKKHASMYVVVRSSIVPLSQAGILPLAKKIVACGNPEYGIGYTRDHRLGPAPYAVGIPHGLEDDRDGSLLREETLRISFWMNAITDRVWRQGLLRDIYTWNFLNTIQLDMSVDGISLRQWIQEDSGRGMLE